MRIVTEDNVDQLLSMSFSNNINKLMKDDGDAAMVVKEINENITKQLREVSKAPANIIPETELSETQIDAPVSPPNAPVSPPNAPG